MSFLYELFGGILRWIYDLVGNYGLSIVLFAIFAKMILLPLTIKQTHSMQMMKFMNPKTSEIQKKYAHDKNKMNEETMKLYKQYGYNPLSGCLPLLIQMPIIIGLFRALREPFIYVFSEYGLTSIDMLKDVVPMNFLWVNDLTVSALDIFKSDGFSGVFFLALIIPLGSVALTYIQQKLTQQSQPQGQKGMQVFMTVFIGYISFTFSQGLALYWVMQTGLGIVQTLIIEKFFPAKLPEEKGGKKS